MRPAIRPAVRSGSFPCSVRAAGQGDGMVLRGYFAVFNQWTLIDSWEGTFLERFAPGAFATTIAEDADRMRCIFSHGQDMLAGSKPLGPISQLREDAFGVAYEVPLLADAAYVAELVPGLRAGLYGASFRFVASREEFDYAPEPSPYNAGGALPERTVVEAQVFEFGPTAFPAYATATAGLAA